ncbi:hypothetical protein GCM10020331_039170 [Ectobacillus funiculus]
MAAGEAGCCGGVCVSSTVGLFCFFSSFLAVGFVGFDVSSCTVIGAAGVVASVAFSVVASVAFSVVVSLLLLGVSALKIFL